MNAITTVTLAAVIAAALTGPAESETIRHTLRCESQDFSSRRCALPLAPRKSEIEEIRLVRQLSTKPCQEGRTWFADESEILVKNGCRAEFQVVYRVYGGFDRYERPRHDYHPGDKPWPPPPGLRTDPSEVVMRSFEDVLGRPPSRNELRYYREMIIDRGWSERDVRRDLREGRRQDLLRGR